MITSAKSFITFLEKLGCRVKNFPIRNGRQIGVDTKISEDLTKYALQNRYDKAILVSGDADFLPQLRTIKRLGKKVEIWCFKSSRSKELVKKFKASIHYIDDIIENMLFSAETDTQSRFRAEI